MNKVLIISEYQGVFTYGYASEESVMKATTKLNSYLNDLILNHESVELMLTTGRILDFRGSFPIFELSKENNLYREESVYNVAMKVVQDDDISYVYFRKGRVWEKFSKHRFVYELRQRPRHFSNGESNFRDMKGNIKEIISEFFGFSDHDANVENSNDTELSKNKILSWFGL